MRKIRLQKAGSDGLRERFERELNPEQYQAATAPDGFNLILAGPGSGKTRVITYRVAYLIAKGVAAESILLVTFTRRAAREMIGRLEGLIGPRATQIWAGTFHHIGNRILRKSSELLGFGPNFTILDGEDQRDIIELAMQDAGLNDTGKYAPKPSLVLHLIGLAFNQRKPIAEVVADRAPAMIAWSDGIAATAVAYEHRKRRANCMDYDDLLGLWAKLLAEHPGQNALQGRMFRQILVDEMQDTNAVQLEIVESIARAGAGNLTAVGDDAQSIYRFRGADYANILEFPDRNPEANVFRLDTNYRSTPEIVAFTNASIARNTTGFGKALVSVKGSGPKPLVVPAADVYEEADFLCQQILDNRDEGVGLGQMAVLYRNHHDSVVLQGELTQRGIPYTVRGGMRFFEQAHIKDVLAHLRVLVNPRDELAWRRLLQLLPGIGPAKATAVWRHLANQADPLASLMTAETMGLVPAKGKGLFAAFIADLLKVQKIGPEANPSAAISVILQGGYPETLKTKYERPENRLADIEQMAVLAARYDNLERFVTDLLLAGDVQGMDAVAEDDDPGEQLVLSTIHQAKGLEWSRVFIPRLVEDGFPSARSLAEPGGEEEERRIFYVGITRAMDELTLTYPLTITRGGRGPTLLTTPSRFLTELDPALYESAVLETDLELAWSSVTRSQDEGKGEADVP